MVWNKSYITKSSLKDGLSESGWSDESGDQLFDFSRDPDSDQPRGINIRHLTFDTNINLRILNLSAYIGKIIISANVFDLLFNKQ